MGGVGQLILFFYTAVVAKEDIRGEFVALLGISSGKAQRLYRRGAMFSLDDEACAASPSAVAALPHLFSKAFDAVHGASANPIIVVAQNVTTRKIS